MCVYFCFCFPISTLCYALAAQLLTCYFTYSVAKDGNVRMSTRLSAAKAAMGDKLNEQSHKRQADVHENKAKHNY